MRNLTSPSYATKTVRGILIPASKDLQEHGFSHLLMDDFRGIYLVHSCWKSARMGRLNRTRVEIRGVVEKYEGEHPRLFVNSYSCADSFLTSEPGLDFLPDASTAREDSQSSQMMA